MDPTRKRLLFRATHRGMKETDRLVGGFAAEYLKEMTEDQLERFEALLEEADGDLLDWLTGKVPIPDDVSNDVMAMLADYADRV